jgi:hypothetical protein
VNDRSQTLATGRDDFNELSVGAGIEDLPLVNFIFHEPKISWIYEIICFSGSDQQF